MESHPQNPEFRNNPENFHPCGYQTERMKQSPTTCTISLFYYETVAF